MSEIDSIIQITITRETTPVSTASFDIPLILAAHTNFPERTRTYSDLDAVATDFTPASNVYKMALREFGQDLGRPPSILVGKRQVDSVVGTVSSAVVGQTYSTTINGTIYSYVAVGGSTATSIVAALKSAYDLAPKVGITFTNSGGGVFTAAVSTLGTGWSMSATSNIILVNSTPTESWTDALNAVKASNNVWYALNAEVHTQAEQSELATAIQASHKIYLTSTADTDMIAAPYSSSSLVDIASALKAAGITRSASIYLPTADTEFPESAWTGALLPQVAGSASWNFKRASDVTVSAISDTARVNLRSKNANMFTEVAGINIFQDGVMADGRPISEVTISDWIYARMQEQIYFRIINLRKIPFTRAGFAIIESEMRSVLSQAQANGAIDAGWSVQSPDPLAIPENIRAQGIAGTFTFAARLQGEVKKIIIRGNLTI